MKLFYIIILLVSTVLASGMFMRLQKQLAPVFHLDPTRIGGVVILPAIGFLMVSYTPAPVIFGALILTAIGWRDDNRGVSRQMGLALTLLAVSIGLMGVPVPLGVPVPIPVIMLLVWMGWWLFMFSAERVSHDFIPCAMVATLAMLPLALAPILSQTPTTLALDIAIIANALLGGLIMATRQYKAALALRLPLVFLLGYLIISVLIAGAWPFALASLAILVASFFWKRPTSKQNTGFKVQTF